MRKAGFMLAFLGGLLVVGFAVSREGDDSPPKVTVSTHQPGPTGTVVVLLPGREPPPTLVPGATPRPTTSGGGSGTTGSGVGVGSGPATGGGFVSALPNIADRKIIRNATLEVVVDDVSDAVQLIESRAQSAGGFIAGSSMTIEAEERPAEASATPVPQRERAVITLRVPADVYPAVMNYIRGLGNVKSESSDTSEVTEEYTDLEARLRNLQATEQQYLALLAQSEAIPDILTVQDRLNYTRLEAEQVQGRIQLLTDLTELATITVTLGLPPLPSIEERPTASPTPKPVPPPPDEPTWSREAWDDAWGESQNVLETMGVAAITAAVILIWILVPAVLLGIGWRVFSIFSRRRQAS